MVETRGDIRRSTEQQHAADELTQSWLRHQGPYTAAALAQIERNSQEARNNDLGGQEGFEPGPIARATRSTFAGLSPFHGAVKHVPSHVLEPKRSLSLVSLNNNNHSWMRNRAPSWYHSYLGCNPVPSAYNIESPAKKCRATRSHARQLQEEDRANLFEKALELVYEGQYLHWYEFMRIRGVSRRCFAFWFEKREAAAPWWNILNELNAINGTNKCHQCEQVILLKSHRHLCAHSERMSTSRIGDERNHTEGDGGTQSKQPRTRNFVWNQECAKRTPDFVSCVDIIMSSGVLHWRERGGIWRICKGTHKVHKEYCTCTYPVDRTKSLPFLHIDPRYQIGYHEDWTGFERCDAMIRYTLNMKENLHSFYNFDQVTDPDRLPYGLARWDWFHIQMVTLQSICPKRYALTMHLVSLFIAQEELKRFPPVWYADAFIGTQHRPYADSFVESLAGTICEHCLPATDEVICNFLRTRCYPSAQSLRLLGPLSTQLSVFSPFFQMVPLDESKATSLPMVLETLNEELIDSMSMNLICTIM